MQLNKDVLPGALDPENINTTECDEIFRGARNIRISDDNIRRDSKIKKGENISLLRYIVENSYNAATARAALFSAKSSHSRKIYPIVKTELINFLYVTFLDISNKGTEGSVSYREWHDSICLDLIKLASGLKNVDGTNAWTYGNSQKVVNLIVKYLVIIAKKAKAMGVVTTTSKAGDVFLRIYDALDIPVDGLIIEASLNHNACHTAKLVVPPHRCWSKWSRDDYLNYAYSLHRVFKRPLDWEGYAWTAVALSHKRRTKTMRSPSPLP